MNDILIDDGKKAQSQRVKYEHEWRAYGTTGIISSNQKMPEEGAPDLDAFSFPARTSGPVRTYDEEMAYITQLTDCKYEIRSGFVPNMTVPGHFYVNSTLKDLMFGELAGLLLNFTFVKHHYISYVFVCLCLSLSVSFFPSISVCLLVYLPYWIYLHIYVSLYVHVYIHVESVFMCKCVYVSRSMPIFLFIYFSLLKHIYTYM